MNNFIFYNPTRLLFGKGMINQLTQQIPADKRIMITFGGGSVKTNGVYEQVTQSRYRHTEKGNCHRQGKEYRFPACRRRWFSH